MSDRQVYEKLLALYNNANPTTQKDVPPYKLDKLIYLIGKELKSSEKSKEFADCVIECCKNKTTK